MTERDNTNSGVFWKPHPDQLLAGQGKLNINGRDLKIAVLREPIKRDGGQELVVYQKIGVLFVNDRKENDRAPDFSGPVDGYMRIAGWKGEKDGRAYMSLKMSEKMPASGSAPPVPSASAASSPSWDDDPDYDEIPF